MRSRTRPNQADEVRFSALNARIIDLEDRMRVLEARLRTMSVQARKDEAKAEAEAALKKPKAARARPRPRCPGCTLELPKGRRGEYCVWCGFMLSAVRGRATR